MSQSEYKKLKIDVDDEFDGDDDHTMSASPQPTESTNRDARTEETSEERDSGGLTQSAKDPSLVVTRDYHGLAQTVGGNHSCMIVIINRSSDVELSNPAIFSKTGYTRIPPDSRVSSSTSSYCAFRKKSLVLKGTSGVLSYEYERKGRTSRRFAVMWKVPYRVVNREENEVGIKWVDVDLDDPIDSNTHTSLGLYQEMGGGEPLVKDYPTVRAMAKNGKTLQIVNSDNGAELDATFSGSCKAIVKLEFNYRAARNSP